MLIIGTKETISNYRNHPGINQSSLKNIQNGVDRYLQNLEKEKRQRESGTEPEHFIVGGAVDTLLLGTEEEFVNTYYISQLDNLPSDTERKIIDLTFEIVVHKYPDHDIQTIENYEEEIELAIEQVGWQANWKMDTRISKIIGLGEKYFDELKNSKGKITIDKTTESRINSIVNSLRTNARTAEFFNRLGCSKQKNFKVYYQLDIYFEINGVVCKGLFDMVFVEFDKDNNAISILPIDLKTKAGYTIDFISSLRERRYDIQSAWYYDGIMSPTCKFTVEDFPTVTSSTIFHPFTFIVESTTSPGKPLIFEVSEEVIVSGREGSFWGPGYLELLDIYQYQKSKGFREDRIVTETNGILKLDLKGIVNGNINSYKGTSKY